MIKAVKAIKAVIFDIGGVVIVHRYGELYKQVIYGLIYVSSLLTGRKDRVREYVKVYKMTHKLNEGVIEIIKALRSAGYTTSTLGNVTFEKMEAGKGMELHKYFDHLIFSAEVGFEKPDKRIFEIATQKLGLNPNECVFVDDKKENVLVAKDIGFKAILFKNAKHLKEELKACGVRID